MWAEAPHQGLARSQFRAFYHPLELPKLPIRIHFSNRRESNTISTRWKEFSDDRPALPNSRHTHAAQNTRRAHAQDSPIV